MPVKSPTLDPEIVADEDRLWTMLDRVILASPGYRKKRQKVIKHQLKLKEVATPEVWWRVLLIEGLVSARTEAAVIAVARWAWAEGVRYGGRRQG